MTVRIVQGDAREVLRTLPAKSVHCCVTSPPYWGMRDYGVSGQIGLESSLDEYVDRLVAVFAEVRRVLRSDGTLWLNIGDCYAASGGPGVQGKHGQCADRVACKTGVRERRHGRLSDAKAKDLVGVPWLLAFALRADGWYLRSEIIWAKPNPMPESVRDRPTRAHEQVFLLSTSPRYYYDADAIRLPPSGLMGGACFGGPKKEARANATVGSALRTQQRAATKEDRERYATTGANARDVWTIPTFAFSEAHFATFPPKLAENCIKAGTSEHGCCAACGQPWTRVTERYDTGKKQEMPDGFATHAGGHGSFHRDGREKGAAGVPVMGRHTTGWCPTCPCGTTAGVVPCTVLDPFGGAGTTGLVADRLGRDGLLIELNPEYAEMARRRITSDAGLFAAVE